MRIRVKACWHALTSKSTRGCPVYRCSPGFKDTSYCISSQRTAKYSLQNNSSSRFCAKMEGFTFSLRLGGRIIGRVAAELDPLESLACAKGSLTEAAERALGHKVVIKRFMVTVWGRTGFLQPEVEFAPLVECTSVMTSRSVVLDLGIPVVQTSDALQYKSQSPMRRSCSSNSIVSACDHFEFYKESY